MSLHPPVTATFTRSPTSSVEIEEPIHVLCVDDESDVVDLASTMLERQRDCISVVTETNARDALERLRDPSESIDCIVSDYNMPRTDGLEFLQVVRQHYPDLPFILFTGRGNEEIASDAIAVGVTDYLQKGTGTDQYEVLSFHEGFVSIVVPDFGETPVYDLRDCGVYIYTQNEKWRLLDEEEIVERFVIEDTSIEV